MLQLLQWHWPGRLRHLVFLGTPHHGAPLEKVGSWVDTVLGSNPLTRPFAKIGQIRSAGITDLRHGNVLPADWQGADRFAGGSDTRQPLPLPPCQCDWLGAKRRSTPFTRRWTANT